MSRKAKWWTVSVVVPLLAAIIAVSPSFWNSGNNTPPGVVVVEVPDRGIGVAFVTVDIVIEQAQEKGEELPPEALDALRRGVELVRTGRFPEAAAQFQGALEVAALPAVRNNLGAAQVAAGQEEEGRANLRRALAEGDDSGAAELNKTKLARRTTPGSRQGFEVELLRFERRGVLVTAEIAVRNVTAENIGHSHAFRQTYLLNEGTGETLAHHLKGGERGITLQPGAANFMWVNFKDVPEGATWTLVSEGVIGRPFEGLRLE